MQKHSGQPASAVAANRLPVKYYTSAGSEESTGHGGTRHARGRAPGAAGSRCWGGTGARRAREHARRGREHEGTGARGGQGRGSRGRVWGG